MKVIAMIAQKGGVGKTTLAVNLAVMAQGRDKKVALIDLDDPQYSARKWCEYREIATPSMEEAKIEKLSGVLKKLEDDGMDYCFIDTPGRQNLTTQVLAREADICVVPCQPSLADVDANADTIKLLKQWNSRAFAVLNRCRPNRGGYAAPTVIDAQEAIANKLGFPLAPVMIGDRIVFNTAYTDSLAVHEKEPKSVAATEIRKLWQHIQKEIAV